MDESELPDSFAGEVVSGSMAIGILESVDWKVQPVWISVHEDFVLAMF